MPQPVETSKVKKRKHAVAAEEGGAAAEPSTKRSKKEKEMIKEHGVAKKLKVDKGKGRATDDAFRVVRATLTVSVSPVFAADLRGGVEEMLDSMLMRCVIF